MIIDWLKEFPTGILSIVADTFDLWKLITEYLADPEVKQLILAREGKLVIRPDSGNPTDIICGKRIYIPHEYETEEEEFETKKELASPECKGVIKLLWNIFGGTINKSGYKVLDPHIGAIYGDSINLERQVEIYNKLEQNLFAATNIVLGVGSFTYQNNTRDTLGFAAKGAWFEADGKSYDIYKEPVTDDGTKKSLKGLIQVTSDLQVKTQCTPEEENEGLLHVIYEDGMYNNGQTLTEIRNRLKSL